MRIARWTLTAILTGAALSALLGASLVPATTTSASAEDDPEELAKTAKDELTKAIARGKELFASGDLGRKSCQTCHEDPDKPEDDLTGHAFSYPAYSRRARRVVTLQQKINEMIKYKARGPELEADGADIAAIAAYVESIRKK